LDESANQIAIFPAISAKFIIIIDLSPPRDIGPMSNTSPDDLSGKVANISCRDSGQGTGMFGSNNSRLIDTTAAEVALESYKLRFPRYRNPEPGSPHHLQVPPPTRQFLISPPASPPVDWEPSNEGVPCINVELLQALANLKPGEPYELHPQTDDQPGIVVHVCSDDEDEDASSNCDIGIVVERSADDEQMDDDNGLPYFRRKPQKFKIPHTPRPPSPNQFQNTSPKTPDSLSVNSH